MRPKFADQAPKGMAVLLTDDPYRCYALAAQKFYPPARPEKGVHPAAHVHPTATLGKNVAISAGAVIGAHVMIGDDSAIGPNAVIESGVQIGKNTISGA